MYDKRAIYTAINESTEKEWFMSHNFGQIRQDTNHDKRVKRRF
jgi:hypothetical protein